MANYKSPNNPMTPEQLTLLDLLGDINKFETKLKRLNVPPIMYEHIAKLRNETAKWGVENIIKGVSNA